MDPATLSPVEVAIIDSGIDATHPDLVGRIKAAHSVKEEGGRVQVIGLDPQANNDAFGHGTAVASIICRLAPNAVLTDFQVLGADNRGTGGRLVGGLRAAVRSRCALINMSIAAPANIVPMLAPLCERAWYKGKTIVASKRNVPISDEGFPAEFSSCIGVDSGRLVTPYAMRFRDGRVIEITALGEDVPVAVAGGGYTTVTGTSFATPTVTGLCALLLGRVPDLRPFEVRTLLRDMADVVPED